MVNLGSEKRKAIINIVLMYSFILLFPAFGPVLNKLVTIYDSGIYSSIFLLFLSIGFLIPYKLYRKEKQLIPLYKILIIFLTVVTFYSGSEIKIISFILLGVTIARCFVDWIYTYYYLYLEVNINLFFGYILFITYGTLYIGNVVIPSLPTNLMFIFIIIIPVLSFLFSLFDNKEDYLYKEISKSHKENSSYKKIILTILIIYIAAGTTYNGIYPNLIVYSVFDRYLNVLPFLPAVLIAAYYTNRKNSFILVYLGIIFLGFSFVSLFISNGIGQYLMIQSNLQIAWALLDLYAWIAGAKYAIHHNNPRLQVLFIASFLLGTTLGSFINQYLSHNILNDFVFYHAIITLLPLFIALFISAIFKLTDDEEIVNHSIKSYKIIQNDKLTKREKEIARLLLLDKTNLDICSELHISINTLKTHNKNIYRKLGVSNKTEISKYI
ncbi:LuxR C-terminal-related transcriptional regulator [Mycoplasmatota bacterium WC44]